MHIQPRLISQKTLEGSMALDEKLVSVIEDAYVALAKDKIVIPQIQQIPVTAVNGHVCVKSAYVPQLSDFLQP